MARRACDEDGWIDYDGARDELDVIVREDYGDEYGAILAALRADETGETWPAAILECAKLADRIVDLSEVSFTSSELAEILETMIEGDL